jgi:hypothetical protein
VAARALFAIAVATFAWLVFVPSASAALFRGSTAQGERATIRTDAAGVPTRFWLDEYRAPCEVGGRFRDRGAGALPPFDLARADKLIDKGPEYEAEDGALRFSILTEVRAKLVRRDRWKGRFKSRVKVSKRGERIDTCRVSFDFRADLRRD